MKVSERDSSNLALIHAIKSRPILYTSRQKKCKTSNPARNQAWIDLAVELKLPAVIVKSKWKNLRGSYMKFLKSILTNEESVSRFRKWPWGKLMMEMLDPHLSLEEVGTNLKNCEQKHKTEESKDSPIKNEETSNISANDHIDDTDDLHNSSDYVKIEGNEKTDETDVLFLNFAKRIKTFSVKEQLKMTIKFEHLIADQERKSVGKNIKQDIDDRKLKEIMNNDDDDDYDEENINDADDPLDEIKVKKRKPSKRRSAQKSKIISKKSRRSKRRQKYEDESSDSI